MNPKTSFLRLLAGFTLALVAVPVQAAKEFQAGELTVVKNQVDYSNGKSKSPAKINDKLEENSLVDTGANSFTEMQFSEGSVMRLGSGTRFTFQSKERLIKLEEGALLIHTPPGNGGVSVDGGGVVGAVSGSTVMASRDRMGNFTFLVLESSGKGRVTTDKGIAADLQPGQIGIFTKNQAEIRVYEANLDSFIDYSPLFIQFPKEIPGMEKIQEVAGQQSMEVMNEVKFIVGPKDLGIENPDNANDVLARIFEKSRNEIVSSKNLLLTDLSTAAGKEIAGGEGNAGKLLLPPGSIADARQPGGASLAAKSNPGPTGPGVVPGADTDTAAGGESSGNTGTTTGGVGGTGQGGGTTGPVAPVGGGTTLNPPPATPV